MQWWATFGKTTRCCQRARDDEIRTETFDCDRCALRRRRAALWQVNVEAWDLFHRLGNRMVRSLEIGGALLLRETARRSLEDVWDLIARLTLILDELYPEPSSHGQNTPPPNSA